MRLLQTAVSAMLALMVNLPFGAARGKPVATLQLKSLAFSNGGTIPSKFTCDGPDLSPALSWTDPPTGTRAFALIMDDPDAPTGTWVHWVLYDLPASLRELPEGVPKAKDLESGARQGLNDFRRIGYGGPCPPRGAAHGYSFRLYALDRPTQLPAGATKFNLERAMKGHILAQSELIGRFQH
jgi:Raf kinase inhibitor-like YbhB/YbcL family protein